MLKRLIILFTILLLAIPASASNYTTRDEFIQRITKPGTHYILFSGDWCPSCKILQYRLKNAGILDKVIILDISKKLGFGLISNLKIPGIPSVAVAHTTIDAAGEPTVKFSNDWHFGGDHCLFFLMANLNQRKSRSKTRGLRVLLQ